MNEKKNKILIVDVSRDQIPDFMPFVLQFIADLVKGVRFTMKLRRDS